MVQYAPIAKAVLLADPELDKLRFELVPKDCTEIQFWRNYFYRVSLIKHSFEMELHSTSTVPVAADQSKEGTTNSSAQVKEATESKSRPSEEWTEAEAEKETGDEDFDLDLEMEVIQRDASKEQAADEEEQGDWEKELEKELGL